MGKERKGRVVGLGVGGWGEGHVPGSAAEQTGQVAAKHLRGQTALPLPPVLTCCRDTAHN